MQKVKEWFSKKTKPTVAKLDKDQKEFLEYAIGVGLEAYEASTTIDISETRCKYEMNKLRKETQEKDK